MRPIDITGIKFNRLTALSRVGGKIWKFKCDCGTVKTIAACNVKNGHTRSCGCLRDEQAKKNNFYKHGLKKHKLYGVWCNIKNRCYNQRTHNYRNYGGRGIEMCENWRASFVSFYEWAKENGYKERLTIERIDVNGNYCPENCKWIPLRDQYYNKTDNDFITFNGKTQTQMEWARELGMNQPTLRARLYRRGWSVEKALTTPVNSPNKSKNQQ